MGFHRAPTLRVGATAELSPHAERGDERRGREHEGRDREHERRGREHERRGREHEGRMTQSPGTRDSFDLTTTPDASRLPLLYRGGESHVSRG